MQDPEQPTECCPDLNATFGEWRENVEKATREEPLKVTAIAFIAGVLLTIFPIGRLLSGLIQVAFACIRPALLILGVVKAVEYFDQKKKS